MKNYYDISISGGGTLIQIINAIDELQNQLKLYAEKDGSIDDEIEMYGQIELEWPIILTEISHGEEVE